MADFRYILDVVNDKSRQLLAPLLHQPGILPQWLAELSLQLQCGENICDH